MVIKAATAQLKKIELGDDAEPSTERDRILSGLRYLLVDEYQDINAEHYELISALVGRSLHSEDDKLSLLAVGDDDQNIYAFSGSNVRFIKQFADDYQAKIFYLIENYRSTTHIIQCANRVIAPVKERMKRQQAIRINAARRDVADGGAFAALDRLMQGRVHIIEIPAALYAEVRIALTELLRLNKLANAGEISHWGSFAVIARHWETLEPMAALCRQADIPVRLLREEYLLDLHSTREGYGLLSLLKNKNRSIKQQRVLLRSGVLARWFRQRYQQGVDDFIVHPYRAMLAQFILDCEGTAPGCAHVINNVIEALYEFRSGVMVK